MAAEMQFLRSSEGKTKREREQETRKKIGGNLKLKPWKTK
jgi:hypothetical protein